MLLALLRLWHNGFRTFPDDLFTGASVHKANILLLLQDKLRQDVYQLFVGANEETLRASIMHIPASEVVLQDSILLASHHGCVANIKNVNVWPGHKHALCALFVLLPRSSVQQNHKVLAADDDCLL